MRLAAGFWPPRLLNLSEIRGRILAAQITESQRFAERFCSPRFRNLGRILDAEIPRDLGSFLGVEI